MATAGLKTAQEHLQKLNAVFGPGYFERGRVVVTVARDVPGLMKAGHKLVSKIRQELGSIVEVMMEHIKVETWSKLKESSATAGHDVGDEVYECQITNIPKGIREPPYIRSVLPAIEVLLLWEDLSGGPTRGHVLWSKPHPETVSAEEVDDLFTAEIQPFFAKRWMVVNVLVGPRITGQFEEPSDEPEPDPFPDGHVGPGTAVTVLACHAYGHARDQAIDTVAPVRDCFPVSFEGTTDVKGQAKLCLLPATINKIMVEESEWFHESETVVKHDELATSEDGKPAVVTITLTRKVREREEAIDDDFGPGSALSSAEEAKLQPLIQLAVSSGEFGLRSKLLRTQWAVQMALWDVAVARCKSEDPVDKSSFLRENTGIYRLWGDGEAGRTWVEAEECLAAMDKGAYEDLLASTANRLKDSASGSLRLNPRGEDTPFTMEVHTCVGGETAACLDFTNTCIPDSALRSPSTSLVTDNLRDLASQMRTMRPAIEFVFCVTWMNTQAEFLRLFPASYAASARPWTEGGPPSESDNIVHPSEWYQAAHGSVNWDSLGVGSMWTGQFMHTDGALNQERLKKFRKLQRFPLDCVMCVCPAAEFLEMYA